MRNLFAANAYFIRDEDIIYSGRRWNLFGSKAQIIRGESVIYSGRSRNLFGPKIQDERITYFLSEGENA